MTSGEFEESQLVCGNPDVHAVEELHDGGVKGLLIIPLHLDLAVKVEVFLEDMHQVGVCEACILGNVVDEAIEFFGCFLATIAETDV